MSPALLPLAGLPVYRELNDERRRQLTLLETEFFLSQHQRRARSDVGAGGAAGGRYTRARLQICWYFLQEEAAHTEVFKRFCLSYGGKIFRDRHVRFPQEYLPGEETFVFFARALIFEEIADFYNRKLAADDTYGDWRERSTAITPKMKHGTSPSDASM